MQIREVLPHPRGAYWDGKGVNFSLFSAHATRLELCLFDSGGTREAGRMDLPEYTDEVWHGYVPEIGPGTVYGYRVHGPYEPEQGHRFNPSKLSSTPMRVRTSVVTQDRSQCYCLDDVWLSRMRLISR